MKGGNIHIRETTVPLDVQKYLILHNLVALCLMVKVAQFASLSKLVGKTHQRYNVWQNCGGNFGETERSTPQDYNPFISQEYKQV